MAWATASEVKSALGYPSTGAPVSDSDITSFIAQAQDEVEKLYKTKFGNIELTDTATGGTGSTIVKSTASYVVNAYSDMVVWIYAGLGAGQYRNITSNTATTLNIAPNWTTIPDATSLFRVVTLGYRNDILDGTNNDQMFLEYQPLVSLIALTINNISVTPSKVYTYSTGRMQLSTSAESSIFSGQTPQLVNPVYVYGIYPMPFVIKRLVILLSGMKALTAQIGGLYNTFQNINLPQLSGSKGDQLSKVKTALDSMQAEAKNIVDRIYFPWPLFG